MKKILSVILVVLVLITSVSFAVSAAVASDDLVAPCYNNTNTARVELTINSSGKATIVLNCTGISGRTTKIVAESKLQRKSGLLWLNVSGASWTDTTYNYYMNKSHTYQLSNTGTYRVKTTYTVSGSGGANDVINCSAKDTY